MTEQEAKNILGKILEILDTSLPVNINTALVGEALRVAIEKLDES